jgi:hypothetical protein
VALGGLVGTSESADEGFIIIGDFADIRQLITVDSLL